MQSSRRVFLRRSTLAGGAVMALGNPGLCLATWPDKVFDLAATDDAIEALLKGAAAIRTDEVQLEIPEQHQNPALVPIAVTTSLSAIASVSLFADTNETPLLASFEFGRRSVRRLSTRIRVPGSTRVWAIVKSGDEYYISEDSVKIVPFSSQ